MPDPRLAELATYGAAAVVALTGLFVAARYVAALLRRRAPRSRPETSIRLAELPTGGPPAGPVTLECCGVDVRASLMVIAPAGRTPLPPRERIDAALEAIIPGLGDVIGSHGTVVRFWPPQLSTQGFAHAFFGELRLPGHQGRGSPMSAIAGPAEIDGRRLLVGVLLCAAAPNEQHLMVVERADRWRDTLRTRRT